MNFLQSFVFVSNSWRLLRFMFKCLLCFWVGLFLFYSCSILTSVWRTSENNKYVLKCKPPSLGYLTTTSHLRVSQGVNAVVHIESVNWHHLFTIWIICRIHREMRYFWIVIANPDLKSEDLWVFWWWVQRLCSKLRDALIIQCADCVQ